MKVAPNQKSQKQEQEQDVTVTFQVRYHPGNPGLKKLFEQWL